VQQVRDDAEHRMRDADRLGHMGEMVPNEGQGRRLNKSLLSTVTAATQFIWMCQPSGAIRFANGSIMSTVVAPPVARLKRMPRTRAVSRRFNSSSVTLVLTTATPRAVGPNSPSASTRPSLNTP
jgi:hypothetical protein